MHGARTFMLTTPASSDGAVELLFGLFAAEAPKKVVEKLCDRLSEDLRPVFFAPGSVSGDPEARYESALKQANRTIIGFLYDHHLSLPGIKLRGAVGVLSRDRLLISSRGQIRGLLFVPQGKILAAYTLLEETPDRLADPKFFFTLQSGTIRPGARLLLATSELFRALDESHVKNLYGAGDLAKANRDLKNALKNGRDPVTILTLALPQNQETAEAIERPGAGDRKLKTGGHQASSLKPQTSSPSELPIGPDIGELIARGIRFVFSALGRGLGLFPRLIAAAARGFAAAIRSTASLPGRLFRLTDADARRRALQSLASAPDRAVARGIERLNVLPSSSRLHLLLFAVVMTLFLHGLLYSARRERVIGQVKAYEAGLTEIQGLQTDLDANLIYGNDQRSRELLSRLETLVNGLPESTASQKKAKLTFRQAADSRRDRLRRIVRIASPADVTDLGDASGTFRADALAWFKDRLYAFSSLSPSVRIVPADGSAASKTLQGLGGVRSAVAARTGIILMLTDGTTAFWDGEGDAVQPYAGATFEPDAPLLYYQGRLYARGPGSGVTRRPVKSREFGAPSDALQSPADLPAVSGLASDGALYLLSPAGTTRKYLKGLPVGDYQSGSIDPAPQAAAALWTSAESKWLAFIERGGDRLFLVDKKTGQLAAQLTSDQFRGLAALAVDDKGETAYLLSENRILKIPLNPTGN